MIDGEHAKSIQLNMNISNANAEPYRRYHDFHERINVMLKMLFAAAHHTISYLNSTTCAERLGDLIVAAEPSWNNPPIWDPNQNVSARLLGAVGNLGIVSVYSALDDFGVGVEAEISRWEKFSATTSPLASPINTSTTGHVLTRLICRYGWQTVQHDHVHVVLSYFDLVRHCIAHRDARSSDALATLSKLPLLHSAYGSLQEKPITDLPAFAREDEIQIHPKLAIFYSHLGRVVAKHINDRLVSLIGTDGILNMAIAYAGATSRFTEKGALRTPEAALNAALFSRYRVDLEDGLDASRRLRELHVWKQYAKAYRQVKVP
jgi:hypothetical protein